MSESGNEVTPLISKPPTPPPSGVPPSSTSSSHPFRLDTLHLAFLGAVLALFLYTFHLHHLPPKVVHHQEHVTMPSPFAPRGPLRRLRFGSFNIRYDGQASRPVPLPPKPPTRIGGDGERPWSERRWLVVNSVIWEDLDVVGFQEALWGQVQDLSELMGEHKWEWVGVGRDDGKQKGEAVPIFFRRDRFTKVSVEHFWLSLHPDQPGSKDWDAGQTRMVTLLHLKAHPTSKDCEVKEDFYVLNTHWDDRGEVSRFRSGGLIIDYLNRRKPNLEGKLVVLLGDLNSPAEERGYRALTGSRYVFGSSEVSPRKDDVTYFADTKHELTVARFDEDSWKLDAALGLGPFGDLNTFTGFSSNDEKKIIDFMLYFSNGVVRGSNLDKGAHVSEAKPEWFVSRYGVIPNRFEGGALASDHRLVVAEFNKPDGLQTLW